MNTIHKSNGKIKSNNSFDEIQLIKIKYRAKLVGLTISKFQTIHRRSARRIYLALSGKAPQLLSRMIKTIERYEAKQNQKELAA